MDQITEREFLESLLTSDTLAFTRYFYEKRFKRRYIAAGHHLLISEALDKVFSGEITRLMINIFPRSGKTELAVKNFIAKGFAVNPASKFIHLTYSNDLALDNSEEIRDDFIQNPEYQKIFPYVKIKKSSTAKNKWYTTAKGGVYAAAAGGAITGFGAGEIDDITDEELKKEDDELGSFLDSFTYEHLFNGAIIIDDPLKPDSAFSDKEREKTNRRWTNTIKSRANSVKTPIIIIGQRLHPDDFCGHVLDLEGEEWTVLSIPALSHENDTYQSIWESKMPVKELLKLKENDSYTFESQYQQNPQKIEGLLFPLSELRFEDLSNCDFSQSLFSFAVGDPADKGGDFYSMPFCYVMPNMDVAVRSVIFNKTGIEANTIRIAERAKELEIEQIFIESNGGWISSVVLLKNEVKNETKLTPYSNHIEKIVRILSHYEFILKKFVFDVNYKKDKEYNDFITNLTTFIKEGTNKNDDAPDVLAAAANIVKVKYKSVLYG